MRLLETTAARLGRTLGLSTASCPLRRWLPAVPTYRTQVAAVVVLCVVGVRWAYQMSDQTQSADCVARLVEGPCEIVSVVSGSVVIVRQTSSKSHGSPQSFELSLRLLGVVEPSGKQRGLWRRRARERIRQLTGRGPIALRLDKRRMDRDNHALGYILVGDQLLNAELLRVGLARHHIHPGDSPVLARRMGKAQREAYQARRGIWAVGQFSR